MASGDDYSIWVPPNVVLRERATVPSINVESLKFVQGYLTPRYVEYMEDGRRVAELGSKDLERIKDGYACAECLAFFGERFQNCPGCGHLLDVNRDIVDYHPDHWQPVDGRTSDEILSKRF